MFQCHFYGGYPARPSQSADTEQRAMLDGFLLFTIADGRVFASDLNDVNVNALSFTTCQADPDGLLRGIVSGPLFYAMGQNSIEAYVDAGTSPFPLSRQALFPSGLPEPGR
jgi:hypothetical protein